MRFKNLENAFPSHALRNFQNIESQPYFQKMNLKIKKNNKFYKYYTFKLSIY